MTTRPTTRCCPWARPPPFHDPKTAHTPHRSRRLRNADRDRGLDGAHARCSRGCDLRPQRDHELQPRPPGQGHPSGGRRRPRARAVPPQCGHGGRSDAAVSSRDDAGQHRRWALPPASGATPLPTRWPTARRSSTSSRRRRLSRAPPRSRSPARSSPRAPTSANSDASTPRSARSAASPAFGTFGISAKDKILVKNNAMIGTPTSPLRRRRCAPTAISS